MSQVRLGGCLLRRSRGRVILGWRASYLLRLVVFVARGISRASGVLLLFIRLIVRSTRDGAPADVGRVPSSLSFSLQIEGA